jgi:hypothetical protein
MTCRELLKIEHPEDWEDVEPEGFCIGCPSDYGYAPDPDYCQYDPVHTQEPKLERCRKCWDREVESVKRVLKEIDEALANDGPRVLDSGDRTEFPSGAVRDCRVGKGRCDLMPLDVVAKLYELATANGEHEHWIFRRLNEFMTDRNVDSLYDVLSIFHTEFGDYETMLLEVAKQFEDGAKKYGDDNWRKGIPVHCYIDSAIRHYLKYLRGDQDEPHARAFCWNILCCIWTVKHIENGGESNGEGR